jgi:hypothetical protein
LGEDGQILGEKLDVLLWEKESRPALVVRSETRGGQGPSFIDRHSWHVVWWHGLSHIAQLLGPSVEVQVVRLYLPDLILIGISNLMIAVGWVRQLGNALVSLRGYRSLNLHILVCTHREALHVLRHGEYVNGVVSVEGVVAWPSLGLVQEFKVGSSDQDKFRRCQQSERPF